MQYWKYTQIFAELELQAIAELNSVVMDPTVALFI
jgi:hypothetical protein